MPMRESGQTKEESAMAPNLHGRHRMTLIPAILALQRILHLTWVTGIILAAVNGAAQVPSFKSFNTNQFNTNNFLISLEEPLVVTNLTVVSNIITKNVFTTNLYTTNLFVTNIFQDITFRGRVDFTTNVTFVTNIFGLNVPFQSASLDWREFSYTNIFVANLPAGTNDLFTAPAGMRACSSAGYVITTNQSNTSYSLSVKTNSTYGTYSALATTTTNAINGVGTSPILEPGESFAITTLSDGATIHMLVTLFSTNLPIYSSKLYGLSAGTNTLFVVPSGKKVVTASSLSLQFPAGLVPAYVNSTGGNVTNQTYIVPSGKAVDLTTRVRYEVVFANNIQIGTYIYRLIENDRVVLEPGAPGGFGFITVWETDL